MHSFPRILLLILLLLGLAGPTWAQDVQPAAAAAAAVTNAAAAPVAAPDVLFTVNNLWIMIATGLVFIMHLGFATLEAGLARAKNTTNILFKNTMTPCIGLVIYALVGFSIMYPSHWLIDGIFAFGTGFSVNSADLTSAYNPGYTKWTDFLFQGMFAATAATIVSGAVAERIKLNSYLVFSVLFVALSYPITGSWHWGGGWLKQLGFIDFAGSTLVHSVGGWAALIGVVLLGPRVGKYNKDGSANAIPGHSMPLATIGVFLLWLGWFGFNGGSVLSADPAGVSLVLVTTSMAAAAGAIAAVITSMIVNRNPDLSMALNGILAGLVGITAGADLMSVVDAVWIGLIAGVIVVFAVRFFDKIRVDDPVGALSVHLVCGVWGTLAAGIFGSAAGLSQLGRQLVGVVSVGAFSCITATVIFLAIKATIGLRVEEAEEIEGLDLGEHEMAAYPDFQQTYIKSYHAREI